MSNPVCISPLKFYDSLAKQSHRKSYAYGHISPLLAKIGWLPPFQFVIPTFLYNAGGALLTAYLYDAKTDEIVSSNISQLLINSGFVISDEQGFKIAKYKSNFSKIGTDLINAAILVNRYLQTDNTLSSATHPNWNTYYKIPVKAGDIVYYNKIGVSKLNSSASYYIITDSQGTVLVQRNGTNTDADLFGEFTYVMPVDGFVSLCVYAENGEIKTAWNIVSITSPLNEGLYYLKLASANETWCYYSEVFCFTEVTQDLIEIEYWNETGDFSIKNGIITFTDNFHFKLLLKSELGKPEYSFEEESTKRLGYVFVESQVSKKVHKFNTIVPEFICDAMRLIRLCDNKLIRSLDEEYDAMSFEMEAEWQTQGDLASVNCEFETDNVVVNLGGFIPDRLGGDFNNDHNTDFDNQ